MLRDEQRRLLKAALIAHCPPKRTIYLQTPPPLPWINKFSTMETQWPQSTRPLGVVGLSNNSTNLLISPQGEENWLCIKQEQSTWQLSLSYCFNLRFFSETQGAQERIHAWSLATCRVSLTNSNCLIFPSVAVKHDLKDQPVKFPLNCRDS